MSKASLLIGEENSRSEEALCEYAEEREFIQLGRTCRLDRLYCINWNQPIYVTKCPIKKDHERKRKTS